MEYVKISDRLYMRRYVRITRIGSHVFQKHIHSYVAIPMTEEFEGDSLGYVMGLDVILQAKQVHFKCGGEMKFYWDQLRLSHLTHGPRLTSNFVEFSSERGPHGEAVTVVDPSSRFRVNLTVNGTQTPILVDTGSGVSQQPREMWPPFDLATAIMMMKNNSAANRRRPWFNVLGKVYDPIDSTAHLLGGYHHEPVLGHNVLSQMEVYVRSGPTSAVMLLFPQCERPF